MKNKLPKGYEPIDGKLRSCGNGKATYRAVGARYAKWYDKPLNRIDWVWYRLKKWVKEVLWLEDVK